MMPGARRVRLAWGVTLAAGLLAGTAAGRPALAQGVWDARVDISPYPSPYLSDWESNPAIGTLTITNPTAADQSVLLAYRVTDHGGRVIASGRSDPQVIVSGSPTVLTDFVDLTGTSEHDQGLEDQMRRTGRLPEGDHTACVAVTDAGGFVLAEDCVTFTIVYPDPPYLIGPLDEEALTSAHPVFQWTPLQVPSAFLLVYVVRVSEVLGGQVPAQALVANIPIFETTTFGTNLEYPISAPPLQEGRTYAWRVQALDQNGYAASANEGRSEVWTFVLGEGEERRATSIALIPNRDTLRFTGDTARFVATALDQHDVEIPGKRFQWRSADTTVASVDSTGVVTGVGPGETWIVASADGVVDSGLSVTVSPAGLVGGFEPYEPEAGTPSLLQLLQSGSFEEVVPQLIERLQSGEFRIPIPMIAALRGGGDGAGDPLEDGESPHGPSADVRGDGRSLSAAEECSALSFGLDYAVDQPGKTFVLRFTLPKALAAVVARSCVGVSEESVAVGDKPPETPGGGPPEGTPGRPEQPGRPEEPPEEPPAEQPADQPVTFLLVWKAGEPGLPRLALVWKWNGLIDFPDTEVDAGFIVVAWRTMTISAALDEGQGAAFFGEASFEAGAGVTFYVKRRCVTANRWFCQVLTTLYPNQAQPEFTSYGFAGVTASETSAAYGSAGLRGGTSLALGFSLQMSGPVTRFTEDEAGLSMQLGLLIAAQDSMVALEPGTQRHNLSVGIAPTVTLSWGEHGEFTLSVGVEFPGPKIIVFGQLPMALQASVLRVGNPAVVVTVAPRRVTPVALEVALSGTWGLGEHRPFGPWHECGEDATRGDIGGGGGCDGFGQATLIFTWTRMGGDLRQATDSLAHWRRVARERKAEAGDDGDDDPAWREANRRVLEWSLRERSARGVCGGKIVGERCRTWSLRGSVGNGTLMDLLALLVRAIPGVP